MLESHLYQEPICDLKTHIKKNQDSDSKDKKELYKKLVPLF